MEKKTLISKREVFRTNASEIASKLGIELKDDETIRIEEVMDFESFESNYIDIEIVKKDLFEDLEE